MHWLKLELSIISPPETESFERCERSPLTSDVSLSNTMPCISIYIWWMHKWVKTSPIKFDSNTAKLLVADYVWMRGSQLFLEEVTENIIRPLWLQFPSVEYRSRGVPLCGHVTDWLFYSCFFFFFFNCLVWFYCLWSITCTTSILKSPESFSKFNHTGVMEKWVRVRVKGQSEWKKH